MHVKVWGNNDWQFMCLLDFCIQICFSKKSQPQAESQLFSNSVVLFLIKRRGDSSFWEDERSLKGWPCLFDCWRRVGGVEASQWSLLHAATLMWQHWWESSRVLVQEQDLGCYFWCSLALEKMFILPSRTWPLLCWKSTSVLRGKQLRLVWGN